MSAPNPDIANRQTNANQVKLSASVMCADFRRLGEQFRELDEGGVDCYHFDVIDGHFAPNFCLSPGIVSSLRSATSKPFEAHLMVEEPDRFIDAFVEAGCQLIVIHQEVTIHLRRLVQQIKRAGCKVGVALNPVTPLDPLQHVLGDLSQVLLMTVDAGFAAQPFARSVLPKIKTLYHQIEAEKLDVDISVDGGINPRTIPDCVQAGARVLVLGSTGLFNKADMPAALRTIRAQAEQAALPW